MTADLIKKLRELQQMDDVEDRHSEMDSALLEYIDDEEVTEIFNSTPMWYA